MRKKVQNAIPLHNLATLPAIMCLKVPGLSVFTSTLLMHTVCWKLLFDGSHEMIAEECVTAEALTHDGPSGAPRPIIIVQAASFDVFLLTNTERTLIRCGCERTTSIRLHKGIWDWHDMTVSCYPVTVHALHQSLRLIWSFDCRPKKAIYINMVHFYLVVVSIRWWPWYKDTFVQLTLKS